MHNQEFFVQAFVYLLAAVVSVPIAKRLGLGSVLGYLIAGMIIGPTGLALIGEEGKDVMQFAEFGVVMMLFLVGLELEPALLWRLRGPLLGLGGLQVLVTSVAIAGLALGLGVSWKAALAIGMILSLSSTAIVLQTLNEKGLMKTSGGQSAFSVLLFQDLAVIPMLAILPLLAVAGAGEGGTHGDGHGGSWLDPLPGWATALVVLATVGLVIASGRFIVGPTLAFVARSRLREIFTAAALVLVIGIALLMTAVGLSPALGTFLAGVVLANSEYRHELESDIDPFKGLLLGLFFIAVGASIDFGLIGAEPALVGGLVLSLILVKLGVLFVLGRVFKLGLDQNLLFSFGLAQGGEFAFVLFSFATQRHVIAPRESGLLVAVVALTMALTPLLMLLNEKLLQPRFGTLQASERAPDVMDEDKPVIVAGYGRFGQIVGRLLNSNGIGTTLLDIDSDQVDLLRRFGQKVFYGDATRHDLLHAAGASRAKVLILAIDDPAKILELVHTARKHFPHLILMARATSRTHAYDLLDAGVGHVYRETFDSSLRMGVGALRELGFRAYQAERAAHTFRQHDEDTLRELAQARRSEQDYVSLARRRIQDLENTLRADAQGTHHERNLGWDTDSLQRDVRGAPPEPESTSRSGTAGGSKP